MPGVQVRADNIFIPPAQHTFCQLLCNLVRQFRRDLSGSKTLYQMISLHTTQLVPAFFCLAHIGKSSFQRAGERTLEAGFLGFVAVGCVVDGILQRYCRCLFFIHNIIHRPVKAVDGDNGCIGHVS